MATLILPLTFEETVRNLGGAEHLNAQLIRFVQPVEHSEHELLEITAQMGKSGRVVFLLGRPGTGKSTFIQSLTWRPHLRLSTIEQIDASAFPIEACLEQILDQIREIGSSAIHRTDLGPAGIAINYLENLEGIATSQVKAFFRSLNGLLRQYPVLVLWPVTSADDVDAMRAHAGHIAGTLFHRGREVVLFTGPSPETYPTIARNTIAVLNDGRTLENFGLTEDALVEALDAVRARGQHELTIRNYLQELNTRWVMRTGELDRIRSTIPRATEIWFVFSYEQAESVVAQFARKAVEVEEAWRANHGKLYEYIHNNQRAADWDAKRLQYAIGGAFTTRVMYMPTNALVSLIAAYADRSLVDGLRLSSTLPPRWLQKRAAQALLSKTPLVRQLRGEQAKLGKRRSGTVPGAMKQAQKAYAAIARWASGTGSGSDEPLNHAIGRALRVALGFDESKIHVERPHPWLGNVVPDIRVDTPGRHICIEFSYTNRDEPYVAADYILRKLDRYMRQLEALLKQSDPRSA